MEPPPPHISFIARFVSLFLCTGGKSLLNLSSWPQFFMSPLTNCNSCYTISIITRNCYFRLGASIQIVGVLVIRETKQNKPHPQIYKSSVQALYSSVFSAIAHRQPWQCCEVMFSVAATFLCSSCQPFSFQCWALISLYIH